MVDQLGSGAGLAVLDVPASLDIDGNLRGLLQMIGVQCEPTPDLLLRSMEACPPSTLDAARIRLEVGCARIE